MNGSESCDLLQAGPVPTEGQATGGRIPLRSLVSQEGSPDLQLCRNQLEGRVSQALRAGLGPWHY